MARLASARSQRLRSAIGVFAAERETSQVRVRVLDELAA